jgi:hypothetical protein
MIQQYIDDHVEVNGVLWQPIRTSADLPVPDRYGSGGDSALFTGYLAASYAFKYNVTKDIVDLERLKVAVGGMHLLTHITGTPGVICRCAFPTELGEERWGYPQEWQGRIDKGFVEYSPMIVPDPLSPIESNYDQHVYYTRATRDQLTGLLFGLGVTYEALNPSSAKFPMEHLETIILIRSVISQTVEDIYIHIEGNNFLIKDEDGENDTSADDVTDMMKLHLLAVRYRTMPEFHPDRDRIAAMYAEEFDNSFGLMGGNLSGLFNRYSNWDQYYAWNLRYARTFTIWIMEQVDWRKEVVADYIDGWLWDYTDSHMNPFFTFIFNATRQFPEDREGVEDGVLALKSLSMRPLQGWASPLHDPEEPGFFGEMWNHIRLFTRATFNITGDIVLLPQLQEPTSYFVWTKPPWRAGDGPVHNGITASCGLDFHLPYWMGRYYGFIGD